MRITSGEFNINCRTTRRNEKKEMLRATNIWMNILFSRFIAGNFHRIDIIAMMIKLNGNDRSIDRCLIEHKGREGNKRRNKNCLDSISQGLGT